MHIAGAFIECRNCVLLQLYVIIWMFDHVIDDS